MENELQSSKKQSENPKVISKNPSITKAKEFLKTKSNKSTESIVSLTGAKPKTKSTMLKKKKHTKPDSSSEEQDSDLSPKSNKTTSSKIKPTVRRSLSPSQLDARSCYDLNSTNASTKHLSNKTPITTTDEQFQSRYVTGDDSEAPLPVLPTLPNESTTPQPTPNSPNRLLNRRQSVSPMETEGGPFRYPRRAAPMMTYVSQKRPIPTSNRFSEISSDETDEEAPSTSRRVNKKAKRTLNTNTPHKNQLRTQNQNSASQSQNNKNSNTQSQKINTKERMPPIVVDGTVNNIKGLQKQLREQHNITSLQVKYTRYSTLLFTNTASDYNKLLKYAKSEAVREKKEEQLPFHTYTPPSEKTHAFIIRGLDNKPTVEEVAEALIDEHELETVAVYALQTLRPLYMIVTSSSITLKFLKQTVRYLSGIRVTIEERRNTKRIIQCHRCQVWGHATSNCFRPHRCLKCAAAHPTHTCTKPKTEPATCANCGKDHPANATICRVYLSKLAQRDGQSNPQRVHYEDAPRPTFNAWQNRQSQTQRPTNQHNIGNNSNQHQRAQQGHSMDLMDKQQYPELKQGPASQPSTSARQPEKTRQAERPDDPMGDSQDIMVEIRKLINLEEARRALQDLLRALQEAPNQRKRFEVYYNFLANVTDNYNI